MNNNFSQFAVFDKENLGSVRTTVQQDTGDVWFVLTDVCRILGIGNPRDAASRLDAESDRGDLTLPFHTTVRTVRYTAVQ